MTSLLLVAGFVPPVLAAWVLLGRVLPAGGHPLATNLLRAALAAVGGPAIGSLVTYAWLNLGRTLGPGYAAVDAALFLAIAGAARRRLAAPPGAPGESVPLTRAEAMAVAALALAAIALAAALVARTVASPHGSWDAWAIWNLRARFLLRAGADWRFAFADVSGSHVGYPLLLPLVVARLWSFCGETPLAPALVAATFTLGAVAIVAAAVAVRAGVLAGAAAGLLLTGTEAFVKWGPSQCADVPLAALVSAAAALLVLDRDPARPSGASLALAGTFLGLAAWTKEEGLLLAVTFAGWTVVSRGGWRRLLVLGAGAALPALAWLHFRAAIAPRLAAAFTAGQTPSSIAGRILDPVRWGVILKSAAHLLPGRSLPLPLVAVAVALLLGARLREARRSPVVAPLLAAIAGCLVVYASTPEPLEWLIATSLERVLLQPWPALVLGLLALVPARAAAAFSAVPVVPAGESLPG